MSTNSRKLGLTTSEAARRLGVSLSTIRRWSDLGYLRGYRTPGGQRRFSIEQLDDFVTSLEGGGQQQSSGLGDDDTEEPRIHRHHDEVIDAERTPAAREHTPIPFVATSAALDL